MKSNKSVAGYQAAGSRPYKTNTAGRGVGAIDPQFSPLSVGIKRATGGLKEAPQPKCGYTRAA